MTPPGTEPPEVPAAVPSTDSAGAADADVELAPIPPEGTPAPPRQGRAYGTGVPSPLGGLPVPPGWPGGSGPAGTPTAPGGPIARPGPPGSARSASGPGAAPSPWGRRLTKQEMHQLTRWGRTAAIIGVVALALSIMPFLGPPMGVLAIVLGVLARRRGLRMGVPRVAGATPAIVLGIVATMFAVFITTLTIVFWGPITEYQQCVSAANTHEARNQCTSQLDRRILDRLGGRGG